MSQHFESGTQASDMFDMPKFHKIFTTKWSCRELRKTIGFSSSERTNMPYHFSNAPFNTNICQTGWNNL